MAQAWPQLEAASKALVSVEVAASAFIVPQALHALCIGPFRNVLQQKSGLAEQLEREKVAYAQAAIKLLPALVDRDKATSVPNIEGLFAAALSANHLVQCASVCTTRHLRNARRRFRPSPQSEASHRLSSTRW